MGKRFSAKPLTFLFNGRDVNVDDTIDNGLGDLKVVSWELRQELGKFGDS